MCKERYATKSGKLAHAVTKNSRSNRSLQTNLRRYSLKEDKKGIKRGGRRQKYREVRALF